MADSKVSALDAATSIASADIMYLVQSSTDKKVSVANLFADIPVAVKASGKFSYGGTAQTLTSAGAVSITTTVTKITNPDGAGTLTIVDGTDGQIKVIIMTANSGSHAMTISSNIGHSSIVFNAAGKTATLMFNGTVWYFIGGTATVT